MDGPLGVGDFGGIDITYLRSFMDSWGEELVTFRPLHFRTKQTVSRGEALSLACFLAKAASSCDHVLTCYRMMWTTRPPLFPLFSTLKYSPSAAQFFLEDPGQGGGT